MSAFKRLLVALVIIAAGCAAMAAAVRFLPR